MRRRTFEDRYIEDARLPIMLLAITPQCEASSGSLRSGLRGDSL